MIQQSLDEIMKGYQELTQALWENDASRPQELAKVTLLHLHQLLKKLQQLDEIVSLEKEVIDLLSKAFNQIELDNQDKNKVSFITKLKSVEESLQTYKARISEIEKSLNVPTHSHEYSDGFLSSMELFQDDSINYLNRSSAKILILDNNLNSSYSLEKRLLHEGHTVTSLHEFNDLFQQDDSFLSDLDIIIIHENQLKTDFFQRFLALKDYPPIKHLPVIVIGQWQNIGFIEKCLNAGAEDFIASPPNPSILYSRIKNILRKKIAEDYQKYQLYKVDKIKEELQENIEKHIDGYAFFDSEGFVRIYNKAFSKIYPIVITDTPVTYGEVIASFFEGADYLDTTRDLYRERLRQINKAVGYWEEQKDNDVITACHTYKNIDGGVVWIIKDISENYVREKQLSFMAYHDSLTMLPNRKHLDHYLSNLLDADDDGHQEVVTLFFLDLDGFKAINDFYGHDVGDWLLTMVVERLKGCVRQTDLISRLGGDEFCIVMRNLTDDALIEELALRICQKIRVPYIKNDQELVVGVSIGIAFAPNDAKDPQEFLRKADEAMYRAKQTGRGKYVFYRDIDPPVPFQRSAFSEKISQISISAVAKE